MQMKTVLIIIAFITISIFTYLGFYNTFYSPLIEINEEGNDIIVYQHANAHYHLTDSVMKEAFNELYEINGIVVTKGFGIYFEDPKKAGKKPISFNAGCIVEDKDSLELQEISDKFTIEKTPYEKYIVSDFPLKGRMSILIGMYKVYPKLNNFCVENGYRSDLPVMEIYDRVKKKIHYRRKLIPID